MYIPTDIHTGDLTQPYITNEKEPRVETAIASTPAQDVIRREKRETSVWLVNRSLGTVTVRREIIPLWGVYIDNYSLPGR